MTQEEKANAYDEALGKARRYYDEYKTRDNILYVEDMEDMFPELKESEDERIRKWIIGILSTYEHDRDFRNAAIDWLEKQGEQNLTKKYGITGIGSKHAEGKLGEMIKEKIETENVDNADKVEPKFKDRVQPQPKQEWGEEDERNLNDAILFIETGTYSLDKDNLINWLKSLKKIHLEAE